MVRPPPNYTLPVVRASSGRVWVGVWVLLLLPVSLVSAGINLGRGRLVGSAGARVEHDSNLFLNQRGGADWSAAWRGEARYTRDSGLVSLDSAAGLQVVRFREFEEQDAVDPFAEASSTYRPSDKTEARAAVAYRRQSVANDAVSDRTRSDEFTAEGRFEHQVTEKLGWRAAGAWVFSNYLTAGYSDVGRSEAGLHAVHLFSPKLKLLAGLTLADAWTRAPGAGRVAAAAGDWRLTVGAEGEFSPKITGEVSAGLVRRDWKRAGFANDEALFLAARVAWAASEKTTWTLRAMQDLSLSAADQSVRAFDLSLGVGRSFTSKLSVEGGIGYVRAAYRGFQGAGNRDDHGGSLRGAIRYLVGRRATLEAAAGWRDHRSTEELATYRRAYSSVGVTVRF